MYAILETLFRNHAIFFSFLGWFNLLSTSEKEKGSKKAELWPVF